MYCDATCKKKHKKKHKKQCERIVAEQSKQKDLNSTELSISKDNGDENNNTDKESKQLLQKTEEAWQRVSMFILGEVLTTHVAKAGERIWDLLHTLLTTIKNCCSDVPAGFMCGHCESSMNVIRISRAVILSICKLPLELNDDVTRKELDRVRSWVYGKVQEFQANRFKWYYLRNLANSSQKQLALIQYLRGEKMILLSCFGGHRQAGLCKLMCSC